MKPKSKLKKIVITGAIGIVIMALLPFSVFTMVFMAIAPSVEAAVAEDYKYAARIAGLDWTEALALDTVRLDNDFEDADPQHTVLEFLMVHVKIYKKKTYTVTVNGKKKKKTKWVLHKTLDLTKASKIKSFVKDRGYSTEDIKDIMNALKELNSIRKYDIQIQYRDIEDMMDKENFDEEQIDWVDTLLGENILVEMYGDIYDLPEHIEVEAYGYFAWPTPNLYTITSPFGERIHPVDGGTKFHYGIDISGPNAQGSPIIAIADGEVIEANHTNGAAGYNVKIRHTLDDYEWQSRYCHMAQIEVKVGDKVDQGDVIGAVGNTGKSTGPHLHLELKFEGQLLNPQPYISASD